VVLVVVSAEAWVVEVVEAPVADLVSEPVPVQEWVVALEVALV
jgi:hypothetical protein